MITNYVVDNDEALSIAGQQLIDAAYAFWKEYNRVAPKSAAVIWLEDSDDKLVIFTRGEYRDQLMANIPNQAEEPLQFM